jgi:hypothetical protein
VTFFSGRQTGNHRQKNTALKEYILKSISIDKEIHFTINEEMRSA